MNKVELVNAIAEITGFSKKDTEASLKAFEQAVTDELVKGGDIKLYGFLNFDVVDKEARLARNPKTGEEVQVPAKKAPRVKIGKTLKDAVNV